MGFEKKVLFIATVGGFLTQFELNNVFLLQKLGYEVHSAANYREPVYRVKKQKLKDMGVILHHVDMEKSPYMWKQNRKALKQLCDIIRREKISLLHCHTPVGGLLGRLAGMLCREEKPKVIYTAHGFHFYKGAPWRNWLIYYSAERLLARCTDVLITINEEDYRRAKRFPLRRGGEAYKIPGEGLQRERFVPVTEERKKELRRQLGVEEDVFFLLSVGELSGNKNHREIIRLLPEIRRRLGGRKLLYGICGDGFYREDLSGLAEKLELQETVKLYGYQPDVQEYLACADCLVFPSVREGLGMAALEAMSMGIPVIASDNRGTREYMKDGCNGYVCSVKKPEEFAEAIEKMCRLPASERAAMGEEGRRTAEKFDVRNTAAIMSGVYEAVDVQTGQTAELAAEIRYLPARRGSMRKVQ